MGYLVCLEKKESEDFLEYKGHLAFLDLQGQQSWVLLVPLDILEKEDKKVMKVPLEFVFLDLLDLMDSPGLLAFQGLLVLLALICHPVMRYVKKVLQAPQDLQVIKDSKESKERKVTKVTPASTVLELAFQGLQANPVCQVSQVLQDLLESLERRAKKEMLEQLVQKDYQEYLDFQVLQAFQDLKVTLAMSSLFPE